MSAARPGLDGPRTRGREAGYEKALGLIERGWFLHSEPSDDPDLDLLRGDQLYAAGLLELVALDDPAAVAELADVISICAIAQAEGDPELARRAWEAGARAVAHGGEGAGSLRTRARQGPGSAPATG